MNKSGGRNHVFSVAAVDDFTCGLTFEAEVFAPRKTEFTCSIGIPEHLHSDAVADFKTLCRGTDPVDDACDFMSGDDWEFRWDAELFEFTLYHVEVTVAYSTGFDFY